LHRIDPALNAAVMAVDRALLVDVLGPELQERANAWGSLAVQIGQVVGFWMSAYFQLSQHYHSDAFLLHFQW